MKDRGGPSLLWIILAVIGVAAIAAAVRVIATRTTTSSEVLDSLVVYDDDDEIEHGRHRAADDES